MFQPLLERQFLFLQRQQRLVFLANLTTEVVEHNEIVVLFLVGTTPTRFVLDFYLGIGVNECRGREER